MTDPSANPRGGALRSVPIEIRVSVGRARLTVAELLALKRDDVLALDKRLEDSVEIHVGDRLVAHGELLELDGDRAGQLALRVTEVVDPGDAG